MVFKKKAIFLFLLIIILFGCGKKNVTTNQSTTAITTTTNSTTIEEYYEVSYFNWDNSFLGSEKVKEGDVPKGLGTDPIKKANLGYYYDFLGWGPELNEVHSDKTYFALYSDLKLKEEMENFDFESTDEICVIKGIKNKDVTNIVVPDYVTSIDKGAFSGCSALESITLPFIGDKHHEPNDLNQYPFGYIFGTDSYTGGTATQQDYQGSSVSTTSIKYYIPTTLREVIITGSSYIQSGSFYNCSNLTSITIPKSVTSIGKHAFSNCTCEIIWGDNPSITTIGEYAFGGYKGASITIPKSVTSIGSYVFSNCTCEIIWGDNPSITTIGSSAFRGYNVTSITIPKSVKRICENAFFKCTNLTSITIPKSVTTIDSEAFYGCSSLTNVYCYGTQSDWENIEIDYGNTTLTNATIYYYSETEPSETGNYWYYDENGNIVIW